jgi:hypothetical protein
MAPYPASLSPAAGSGDLNGSASIKQKKKLALWGVEASPSYPQPDFLEQEMVEWYSAGCHSSAILPERKNFIAKSYEP